MDIWLIVPPWVYLTAAAGSAVSFGFHCLVGHRNRSSLLYWPFGLAGFVAGGLAAERIGLQYVVVGDISMLPAVVGALIGLTLAHLLVA